MAEVFRKKANAKIRAAEGRGLGSVITSGMDKLIGGTWVGGEVVLTDEFLAFGANRLNRVLHRGDLDVAFDLADINGATISGGIVTKIIHVDLTGGAQFLFRCYGATEALESLLATLPGSDNS